MTVAIRYPSEIKAMLAISKQQSVSAYRFQKATGGNEERASLDGQMVTAQVEQEGIY